MVTPALGPGSPLWQQKRLCLSFLHTTVFSPHVLWASLTRRALTVLVRLGWAPHPHPRELPVWLFKCWKLVIFVFNRRSLLRPMSWLRSLAPCEACRRPSSRGRGVWDQGGIWPLQTVDLLTEPVDLVSVSPGLGRVCSSSPSCWDRRSCLTGGDPETYWEREESVKEHGVL